MGKTYCRIMRDTLISIGVSGASEFTDFSLGKEPNKERNRDIVRRAIFGSEAAKDVGKVHGITGGRVVNIAAKASRKLAKTKGVNLHEAAQNFLN